MTSCNICFEDYDEERLPMVINCGHTFCLLCIALCKNCPMCKNEILFTVKNYQLLDLLNDKITIKKIDEGIDKYIKKTRKEVFDIGNEYNKKLNKIKLNINDFKYVRKLISVKYIKNIINEGIICENKLNNILNDYKKIIIIDKEKLIDYISSIINEIIYIRQRCNKDFFYEGPPLDPLGEGLPEYIGKRADKIKENKIKALFIRFKNFHISL